MDLSELILSRLAADAELAIRVGQRIYSTPTPKAGDRPYLTFQIVDDIPQNTLDGDSGLSRARVQLDAFAQRKDDAAAILRAASGAVLVNQHAGYAAILDSRRDTYEPDTGLQHVARDVIVWYHDLVTSP